MGRSSRRGGLWGGLILLAVLLFNWPLVTVILHRDPIEAHLLLLLVWLAVIVATISLSVRRSPRDRGGSSTGR